MNTPPISKPSPTRKIMPNARYFSYIFFILFFTIPIHNVFSATLIVTTTNDEYEFDGDCSLREAIIAANLDIAIDECGAGSGEDTTA